jgi:tRNA C32,U32 (ribose-2'-O)-methylase TrmJ
MAICLYLYGFLWDQQRQRQSSKKDKIMSEKTARKLRQKLRQVNVDVENPQRFRHSKTMQIVASEGRRIYKRAKKKAREIRKTGTLPQI